MSEILEQAMVFERIIGRVGDVHEAVNYIERVNALATRAGVDIATLLHYFDVQEKGEAGIVAIMPLAFTHAIISDINSWGYGDRWCYHSYGTAKRALNAWDGTGEPQGWHRHPHSGRRRDKDGNETIRY